MRRGVVAAAVVALAVVGGVAFLLLASMPACGCSPEPWPGITVEGVRVDDGYDLRVASLDHPARGQRYAELDVVLVRPDDALSHAEWSATRDGAPLRGDDLVEAGDVIHVRAAEGERVRILDRPCNCYVADWPGES